MSSFLAPLVARLTILTKDAGIVDFTPNWAQLIYLNDIERQLRAQIPIRTIVLKARQIGISTATMAYIYSMSFARSNLRSHIIADEADNANHLLSMADLYWETDPFKSLYTTKYQAKNTLHWVETGSSIRTMTAGNKKAGRSRTIHQLHASEVAFWMEAELVMTGLLQAVPQLPGTFICLESTANGIGNYFNDTWNEAMAGQNEYTPLFFPWWMHPDYRASAIRLPAAPLGHLDEEERGLTVLFKVGLTVGQQHYALTESLVEDALRWRRWAIRNLCQNDLLKFHQEYPSTPEEAFISTGTNIFPAPHLGACYKREEGRKGHLHRDGAAVTFQPDIAGPLTIFRHPNPDTDWGSYTIGGDATATMHGDFAVGQVFNRRTLEQVAIWRGRVDPARFGEELAKLGKFYNTALLAPENEGPGFATIGALQQMDYPNLYQSTQPEDLPGRYTGKHGWSSSYKTKEFAIGWLLKLVVDHQLTIHDRVTYDEMLKYVTLEGGGYGPAGGEKGHDDTVMATAIAIAASVFSGPVPVYGGGTEMDEAPSWESWGDEGEGSGGSGAELTMTGGWS